MLSSKWWNNKASDIKLVYLYSTIKMMQVPINLRDPKQFLEYKKNPKISIVIYDDNLNGSKYRTRVNASYGHNRYEIYIICRFYCTFWIYPQHGEPKNLLLCFVNHETEHGIGIKRQCNEEVTSACQPVCWIYKRNDFKEKIFWTSTWKPSVHVPLPSSVDQ